MKSDAKHKAKGGGDMDARLRIHELLEKRGWTLQELSDRTAEHGERLSVSQLSNVARDERGYSKAGLVVLAKAFDVPVWQLFAGSGKEPDAQADALDIEREVLDAKVAAGEEPTRAVTGRPPVANTLRHNEGVDAAIEAAGSVNALAEKLGITVQAIYQWDRVPTERCIEIERITGVSRHILRPDIYGPTENGAANGIPPSEVQAGAGGRRTIEQRTLALLLEGLISDGMPDHNAAPEAAKMAAALWPCIEHWAAMVRAVR